MRGSHRSRHARSLQNRPCTTDRRRSRRARRGRAGERFALRIAGEDVPHVPDVLFIHADEEIKVNIILRRDLPRGVTGTWDAVLGELFAVPGDKRRFRSSSRLVAAEAMKNSSARPAFDTRSFITYSAIGLRQMLPWQIKSILVMVFSVLFRCAYCTTTERKCAPQIFGVVCHCGEGLLHYGPITVPFLSSAQKSGHIGPFQFQQLHFSFRSLRRTRSDCRLCRQRGGRE